MYITTIKGHDGTAFRGMSINVIALNNTLYLYERFVQSTCSFQALGPYHVVFQTYHGSCSSPMQEQEIPTPITVYYMTGFGANVPCENRR